MVSTKEKPGIKFSCLVQSNILTCPQLEQVREVLLLVYVEILSEYILLELHYLKCASVLAYMFVCVTHWHCLYTAYPQRRVPTFNEHQQSQSVCVCCEIVCECRHCNSVQECYIEKHQPSIHQNERPDINEFQSLQSLFKKKYRSVCRHCSILF